MHDHMFDVELYGASPSGSAARNTAAINDAAQRAGSTGVVYMRPGATFATNGTVSLHGPTMARGAAISYRGNGVAIQVGDGRTILQDVTLELPSVLQAAKTGPGWGAFAGIDVSTSVGVQILKAYNCRFFIDQIRNFGVGLMPYGKGRDGCDYNSFFVTILSNNKVNLKLDADAEGWVNENSFFGGRLKFDSQEGVRVPGTKHIEITRPASGEILNNHRFYSLSLEGDTNEYVADLAGSHCLFDQCRYEGEAPRIRITGSGNGGAGGIANRFMGGYGLRSVSFSFANGAFGTRVESENNVRWGPAPGDAVMILANRDSSNTPTLMGLDAGHEPVADVGSAWSWYISARHLKGKLPEDAEAAARIDVDFATGDLRTRGSLRTPSDSPAIDNSNAIIALTNGSSRTVPGIAAGLVFVADGRTRNAALIALGGGGAAVVWQSARFYSTNADNPGTLNLYASSGNLVVQNRSGAEASITTILLKAV